MMRLSQILSNLVSGLVLLLVLCLATSSFASGGGGGHGEKKKSSAAKSGHGAAAKKEPSHGKKDAKKSGHGGGHGSEKSHEEEEEEPKVAPHVSDVEQILSLITSKEKKHDPRLYIEVDLGEFRITRPGQTDDDIFLVKFHIYGVLPETDNEKFDETLEGRQQRMRDAVLSVVHKTQFHQLEDPALDIVKGDLVAAVNRVLEDDLLRDVVFSTFSMERD